MADRVEGRVTIRDADILPGQFRNFTGRQTEYNPPGKRTFYVRLDPELGEALLRDGWNVKTPEPRGDEDEQTYRIQVRVRYDKGTPPRIVLISSKGRQDLNESNVTVLDAIRYAKVDLIFTPYNWESKALGTGVTAYLKTMYVTIDEDELEAEYGIGDESPGTPYDNPGDSFNE